MCVCISVHTNIKTQIHRTICSENSQKTHIYIHIHIASHVMLELLELLLLNEAKLPDINPCIRNVHPKP